MAIKTKATPGVKLIPQFALASDGWEDVPDEVERRSYTCLIYGDTGTGRTRLALTAPGPIALAHTAEKIDGPAQEAKRRGTIIRAHNFGTAATGTNQQISDQIKPIWDRMVHNWNSAVDTWARTAILDTDTEAWELCRLAYFGELNPRGRIDNLYGPVNQRWRSILKRNKLAWRCNVIVISQTKDEWKDVVKNGAKVSERTGRTLRVGQREVPIMADVILRTDRYTDPSRGMVFTATIEKGWFNRDAEGISFENEDCSLPHIMEIITGFDRSEWSV